MYISAQYASEYIGPFSSYVATISCGPVANVNVVTMSRLACCNVLVLSVIMSRSPRDHMFFRMFVFRSLVYFILVFRMKSRK